MKKALWITTAAAILAFTVMTDDNQLQAESADRPLSDRIANYRINVEAIPQERRLAGEETLAWTNRGSLPVGELYFHLYPNAFKSPLTTFMREKRAEDPQFEVPVPGKIEIASIMTEANEELARDAKYVQPDDDNSDDETLLKVPLLHSVAPGSTATLKVRFEVMLPSLVRRMGLADDFLMAGQWFPKVAVYETAGMRGRTNEGWNLHQYHANSEFYSDFGEYRVAVHIPEEYKVAGTGRKLSERPSGRARKEYDFHAPDVHDFAWSASPNFVQKEITTAHGVNVHLFLDPRHSKLADRYLKAAVTLMDHYYDWFGPYPYPDVTIVVPSKAAAAAGSMEYPTLVMVAPALEDNPDVNLERVMAHELAHQYWYGVVANNEFEEPWLDEGFAAYAEEKAMRKLFHVNTDHFYKPYSNDFNLLKRPAWQYSDRVQYVNNAYIGGKHVLQDIEERIGEEQMTRLLHTYMYRWQFKHPGTQDFIDTLEEVSDRSWHPYFAAMHAVDDTEGYANVSDDTGSSVDDTTVSDQLQPDQESVNDIDSMSS